MGRPTCYIDRIVSAKNVSRESKDPKGKTQRDLDWEREQRRIQTDRQAETQRWTKRQI